MWIRPDEERLSQLDLLEVKLGDWILFCPDCLFQFPPNTAAQSKCPNCRRKGLNITTVDEELLNLER